MRTWARANRRRKRKLPKCVSCSKPIPRSEPDAILEDLATGRKFNYHERCSMSAYIMLELDEPGAWRITHRCIDERMN
jgi:hypothetical protein